MKGRRLTCEEHTRVAFSQLYSVFKLQVHVCRCVSRRVSVCVCVSVCLCVLGGREGGEGVGGGYMPIAIVLKFRCHARHAVPLTSPNPKYLLLGVLPSALDSHGGEE